ncbi:tetratricopeptide repeat protein [Bacteroides salyersiae]|uniref:tetratricopeptide repeat protein n=1 Tax=Bacteroides salyersiae TaxID=291644 RepID=UPI001D07E395|nr:tetratricopeptide repeat protein [Bacteroides salyersiae]
MLQKADSLMKCCPDSALLLLGSVEKPDALLKADQAYYALLLTQAEDKNYIRHTTDSLIRVAVRYYDARKDVARRMKSHYYLARVCQDMDSLSVAVREFMIANQMAEKIKDSVFTYLSVANLGHILKEHDLLDEADLFYRQAEEIAALGNDSLYLGITLLNRAEISIMKGEKYYSEAEKRLLHALRIARDVSNIQVEQSVVGTLGALYSNMERYNDVIKWEQYYLSAQPDSLKKFGSFLNLGDAFYHLGQSDSAFYYLSKSALSPNYYTKAGSYKRLGGLAEKESLLIESLHWKDSCLVYTNLSASLPRPVEVVTSLKKIINEQSIEYYKYLAQWQWWVIVFIFIIGSGFFVYFTYRYKQSRSQLLTQFEKRFLNEKEQLNRKETTIQELQKVITECEGDHAKVLLLKKQLDDVYVERDKLFNQLLHALPIFQKLVLLLEKNRELEISKTLIDDKMWKAVVEELNSITENFTIRLTDKYSILNKDDLLFCCLLKMGFGYSDIACFCGRTLSMMYKRRNSIVDKMRLEDRSLLDTYMRLF